MAVFSEVLKSYIEQSKISIQSLAKISGVNRTHIQKMIKGERTPADKDILNKLINIFMLTPEQTNELRRLYLIARMGEGVYDRHMLVKEFIESIGSIDNNHSYPVQSDYLHNLSGLKDVNVIYGTSDINNILKTLIEVEASKPNGHIRMIVQPDYTFLMELLTSIGRSKRELTITHIMCLKRETDRNDENRYNIKCIKNIAPLLVSGCNYNPMFYYDDVGGNINAGSIFPYMLLTGEYVINISGDLSYASIFRTEELYNMYSDIYARIHSFSKELITKLGSPMELLMHYENYLEDTLKVINYCFFKEPCLAIFFTPEIINKYITKDLPGRDEILKLYSLRLSNHNMLLKDSYCLNSYFSENGIDSFLNTGRITEIPFEYYTPFDRNDCLLLLNSMKEHIERGSYNPVIIDSQKFSIPANLVISAMSANRISMIYTHPVYGSMAFALNETSISYSVHDFLNYLKNSDLIIPRERTLDIINSTLSKLNK